MSKGSNLDRIILISDHFELENFIEILHMPNLRLLGIEEIEREKDLTEYKQEIFTPTKKIWRSSLPQERATMAILRKMGF